MVQTILASMGAKNFGVTTRRRRTRTSKMTLVKMARQQQQGLLTDEEDLKWKVRQFGTFPPQHAEFASGVNPRGVANVRSPESSKRFRGLPASLGRDRKTGQ
jgi:hypothetical protein